ncbi:methyltransferase domain-containing protein [Streptomyces sp. HNM0574]|nr:methyltransferase domain-containing protein [Streptomyces sp. HNM0574]
MYDRFGDMLAMLLGDSAVHIGMFVPHGKHQRVADLVALADHAQDRQTDHLIDTIGLAPDGHLLDIGCGTGDPAVRLARRSGGRVTGVTVSKRHLDRCVEAARTAGLADRVTFAYGNAMELAYGDGSFDAAWAIDCFPHLADRAAALREAYRVLRPGGYFLFTDFALRGSPSEEQVDAYTQLWCSPAPTSFATLLSEVGPAGFEVTEIRNMSSNAALTAELMCTLYKDRRAEIEERFGAEATAHTDPLMDPFRTFCRDHVDYYLTLVRKPETAG